jgi:dolichyl-phosphate beta-glucosyltransferase
MEKRIDVSIVIPAYNEAERIGPTLEAVARWANAYPGAVEVIVVDDGSPDGTLAAADAFRGYIENLVLLRYTPNRGKGYAVKTGMLAARGRYRAFMDADNSIPVEHLEKALPLLEAGVPVVIGSRKVPGAKADHKPPLFRRVWSRISNGAVQGMLVPGIHDTQCGFKAFTAEAAERIFPRVTLPGWAFDLEALAVARHLGLAVREIPVSWTDDRRTRVDPIRDLGRVTRDFAWIKLLEMSGHYDRAA